MRFVRVRKLSETITGTYAVRTDIELLGNDLSEWPKDKLCFPWRTTCDPYAFPVNDMLFYIPRFKFDDLRGALAQAQSFARRDLKDLHWLGDVPSLREHVWLQCDFFILRILNC